MSNYITKELIVKADALEALEEEFYAKLAAIDEGTITAEEAGASAVAAHYRAAKAELAEELRRIASLLDR